MLPNLGKFKKSLTERCPHCNHILEVRVRETSFDGGGFTRVEEKEYIACSNCDYEREIKNPHVRKERFDKTQAFSMKRTGVNRNGYNQRGPVKSGSRSKGS